MHMIKNRQNKPAMEVVAHANSFGRTFSPPQSPKQNRRKGSTCSTGSTASTTLSIDCLQDRQEEINRQLQDIMARISSEFSLEASNENHESPVRLAPEVEKRLYGSYKTIRWYGNQPATIPKSPSASPCSLSSASDSDDEENVFPFPGAATSGRNQHYDSNFSNFPGRLTPPDRTPINCPQQKKGPARSRTPFSKPAAIGWSDWFSQVFCACNSREQTLSAPERAAAANRRFERQHLLSQQRQSHGHFGCNYGANQDACEPPEPRTSRSTPEIVNRIRL